MKLIIDIPEVDYNYAKQQVADGITNPLKIFIASGIPLEQIRAEIADLDDAEYEFEGYYKAVTDALQVIDKYKAERSDKE